MTFTPVPKPESTKKKKSKGGPTKTVNMEAVEAKKRTRQEQNNINRNFGKSIERNVAKLTGGERVPASGAIKNSVFNLEGDVRVPTPDNKRVLALIECKGASGITPKGEKVFALKYSVLKQARDEGRLVNALPVVWVHWRENNYPDDFVILPSQEFLQILEDLKELYTIESNLKESI